MIASIDFFRDAVRVRFLDGGCVDLDRFCVRHRATDADARRAAARVALQARAAAAPEAGQFRELERLLLDVSELCYRLYDKVRQGDSALFDYWRLLMLAPDAPPAEKYPDHGDALNVRGSVPQQVGKLTARLHKLARAAASDIVERITFMKIVSAVAADAKPDHYYGPPYAGGTTVGKVAIYFPPGAELPERLPESPAQRRRRQRATRQAALGPAAQPALPPAAPAKAATPKLLSSAKGKAAGKKS